MYYGFTFSAIYFHILYINMTESYINIYDCILYEIYMLFTHSLFGTCTSTF